MAIRGRIRGRMKAGGALGYVVGGVRNRARAIWHRVKVMPENAKRVVRVALNEGVPNAGLQGVQRFSSENAELRKGVLTGGYAPHDSLPRKVCNTAHSGRGEPKSRPGRAVDNFLCH